MDRRFRPLAPLPPVEAGPGTGLPADTPPPSHAFHWLERGPTVLGEAPRRIAPTHRGSGEACNPAVPIPDPGRMDLGAFPARRRHEACRHPPYLALHLPDRPTRPSRLAGGPKCAAAAERPARTGGARPARGRAGAPAPALIQSKPCCLCRRHLPATRAP
ncbi:hypothetical protein LNKW23_04640 [Paralimibaculum aggregatum]|uniref:Uncharacterized protein n=1 Tax=Paralimibaculum aggregatum TaxID=3036245 RepID=A0ABQ6LFR5_9RHOB|nr:hypothetical protein LNKW23_04640 [Limibaculum sp. NKW23]